MNVVQCPCVARSCGTRKPPPSKRRKRPAAAARFTYRASYYKNSWPTKREQAVARLKLGSLWHALDLVFCSETGTPLSIPNLTYRYFRPILTKAELPQIRLYDLRHSCATLLLIAEESPKVVSERLGHSTIVLMLDTYNRVLPTMQQKATARLEKMLYESKRKAPAANQK